MSGINNPFGTTMHSKGGKAGALNQILDNNARGADSQERFLYEAEVVQFDSVGGKIINARNAPDSDYLNPRNSILARVYTRNLDVNESEENLTLCYPIFPPHMQLPLKIGERVFVIFADPLSKNFAYWLCRIPEPYQIDDLNYNFSDDKPYALSNEEPESSYGFDVSSKLKSPGEIQKKIKESIESSDLVQESVPGYARKSHETVFQGSNNSLIRMTVDSGEKNSGAIDIVVGRGREGSNGFVESVESNKPFSSGYSQPDKTNTNENEGKIDFDKDSARIYVSMQSNVDEKFGTEDTKPISENESSVVLKADAVRIVARQSVKIVSENGESSVVIDQDGNIKIGSGNCERHIITREDMVEYINTQIKSKFDSHTHGYVGNGGPINPAAPASTTVPANDFFGASPVQIESADSIPSVSKILVD